MHAACGETCTCPSLIFGIRSGLYSEGRCSNAKPNDHAPGRQTAAVDGPSSEVWQSTAVRVNMTILELAGLLEGANNT